MNGVAQLEPIGSTFSSEDEPLFEIINGQRVELPPMSAYATLIATILGSELYLFGKVHGLGKAAVETLFHLNLPSNRDRRPDVAFVSFERWPKGQPQPEEDKAWHVVPDLAVEVVSPTDGAEDLLEKIADYFLAGVRMVWVVYPRQRLVHIYDTWHSIRVLTSNDILAGEPVLPGFKLPLIELFQQPVNRNGAGDNS
jgi:Uma2 family endonuclease